MKTTCLTILTGLAMTGGALAEGDPASGEREFNKCRACHMIVDERGETIQRGGDVGPNLFGVAGRQAGSVAGYAYSDAILRARDMGLEWTEADFVAYVADPSAFLRTYTGDNTVRAKMTFKLPRKAEDVFAYLQGIAPAP